MTDCAGKTALIIGGTAGIGLAAAQAFYARGANIVLAGLPSDETAPVLASMDVARSMQVATDVTDEGQVEALVAQTVARFGRLDIAVNNAGVTGKGARVQDVSVADFDKIVTVNLKGLWLGMKYQIRQMREQGVGGSIINTASTSGIMALPFASVYSATKHGVIGMTKAAAIELAKSGIRVNAVAPGAVRTALFDSANSQADDAATQFARRVPMGRLGGADEIAEGIVWLGSDSAAYVTGHVLVLDGGLTLV